MFLYQQSLHLKEFLVPLNIAGPHNPDKIDLNYKVVDFEKVLFSKKIYRAIRYELSYILNTFYKYLFFYKELIFCESSESKKNYFYKEFLIRFIENFDYNKDNFVESFKYHFNITNIKDEKKFLILLFKLYYFVKLESLIFDICRKNNLNYYYKNKDNLNERDRYIQKFNRWTKKSSRYDKMFKELNS